jgi:hypothetical protein
MRLIATAGKIVHNVLLPELVAITLKFAQTSAKLGTFICIDMPDHGSRYTAGFSTDMVIQYPKISGTDL